MSSRTEPDSSCPPGTGTLTLNDANPPQHAQKESRRTPVMAPAQVRAFRIVFPGTGHPATTSQCVIGLQFGAARIAAVRCAVPVFRGYRRVPRRKG